jgi:hypothetical protein
MDEKQASQDDKRAIDIYQAIEILKQQVDKIDPYTGKILEVNSAYENILLSGALFEVIEFVKENLPRIPHIKRIVNRRLRYARKAQLQCERKPRPEMAGRTWYDEETKLLEECFDSGIPIAEIAKSHHRTVTAIAARLVKIGKVSSRDEARRGIRQNDV